MSPYISASPFKPPLLSLFFFFFPGDLFPFIFLLFFLVMDVRRRPPMRSVRQSSTTSAGEPPVKHLKPSDALPLPLYLTNGIFFALFFSVAYFLLHRWREKIRTSTPLHVLTLSEIAAIVSMLASVIYLLGFFGVDFVQSLVTRPSGDVWDAEDEPHGAILEEDSRPGPCAAAIDCCPPPKVADVAPVTVFSSEEEEEMIRSVVAGSVPSYLLESKLGDCKRAAAIRREALQRTTGRSLAGLPLDGFDYEAILGQCCEMPVGYVQIPVGIAGPLLLDGREYWVPMATTEGCLVASTNRGCKAIFTCGGASSMVLRDRMTRAPVVRFPTASRAADLKLFVEDPINFDTLAVVFNRFLFHHHLPSSSAPFLYELLLIFFISFSFHFLFCFLSIINFGWWASC